jgi:hypothetical protein
LLAPRRQRLRVYRQRSRRLAPTCVPSEAKIDHEKVVELLGTALQTMCVVRARFAAAPLRPLRCAISRSVARPR